MHHCAHAGIVLKTEKQIPESTNDTEAVFKMWESAVEVMLHMEDNQARMMWNLLVLLVDAVQQILEVLDAGLSHKPLKAPGRRFSKLNFLMADPAVT